MSDCDTAEVGKLHYVEMSQVDNGKLVTNIKGCTHELIGLPSGFMVHGEDGVLRFFKCRKDLQSFIFADRKAWLVEAEHSSLSKGKPPTPLFRGEYEFECEDSSKKNFKFERFVVYATPFIYVHGWTLTLNRWVKPKDYPDPWKLPKTWWVCAKGARLTVGWNQQSAVRNWKKLFGTMRFFKCEEVNAFEGELDNYTFEAYVQDHPTLFEDPQRLPFEEQHVEKKREKEGNW